MRVILLCLLAYLLGSIPTSLWLARRRGIDLRQWGSGNLGATNLYRATGPGLAAFCMVFDISKGLIPTLFFPELDGVSLPQLALLYGAAAVIGHIFSLFARFRGGKGVATGAGVYVALAPAAVGLAFAVWLVVVSATRIVSVASLSAATLLPAGVWLSGHRFDFVFWSSLPLASLVWWTHRSNVRRLLAGREPRVARGSGRPADPGARPHESSSEA
ncbi:MAG: glycerol-3-phosphate 1-O-acyltransferase PlsY [Gemmatimonadota bacterium]|nr:MAG: glycerol-3-phosphate 1-O-acyltransferase PlsY [Gemmatimonadota bacterium]